MHQGKPAAGSKGRIGPVFDQQHPGSLGRGLGQQQRLGVMPLQIKGNGRGIGNNFTAIQQHWHLALARQAEEFQLAQAGRDLDHRVVEPFGGQHQPHLLAKGRMPELVQFHASNLTSGRQSSQQAARTDHPGR